jgi:LuxR family maltose regulon positive regulatory protein
MTFARTKIQAPQPRATFIARHALQDRLARALRTQRLVLICAPAGFGKTTALANEVSRLPAGHALAWVSADQGDDLHRLLECMVTALEPYDPPWRTAPEALIARATEVTADARRAIAAEILNTLDASDVPRGLIVFEDAHRITDRAFFEFADLLIERLGARWTIAITTREDLPLSLARLRAADELGEFRQSELQFDRDEARALAAGAGLDEGVADRLFDRTQGWPAGLRLAISAASAAGARAQAVRPPDIDRQLFDYLVAEVVDRLRPELRDFLSHVSVLPELEPMRCAKVSGNPHAARLLDEVERLGLFVDILDTADAPGGPAAPQRILRLHDLLRDALKRRLQLDQPQFFAQLQQRAAATEPDPVRRIGLLLAAGDANEAARMLERHGPPMLSTGAATTVAHLLKSFDPDYLLASPELQYVSGLVAWYYWHFSDLLACMARAEAAYAARGDRDGELFARAYRASAQVALGRLAEGAPDLVALHKLQLPPRTRIIVLNGLTWLALETGELYSIGPMVDEMVSLLNVAGHVELWYQTTPATRLPGLPGMAKPLQRHAEALLKIAGDEPIPLRALAYSMQARRFLWEGDFERAAHNIALASADERWARGAAPVRAFILAHRTLWHAMKGESNEAIALMRMRLDENPAGYGHSGIYHLLQFSARIAAICNDLPMLRDSLRQLDQVMAALGRAHPGSAAIRHSQPQRPLAGNIAWLEGRIDDAIAHWTDVLRDEESIEILSQGADVRVRLACALLRRNRVDDAAAVLQPVFALVEREHTPGGALLAADALREIAAFDWGARLPGAQHAKLRDWWQLLAAFRAGAAGTAEGGSPSAPAMPAPKVALAPAEPGPGGGLSPRELEVLQRIAAGDSNKLIARAFDLSLHTVKRHVAHILDKLQLDSRGQAAAWYRQRAG